MESAGWCEEGNMIQKASACTLRGIGKDLGTGKLIHIDDMEEYISGSYISLHQR